MSAIGRASRECFCRRAANWTAPQGTSKHNVAAIGRRLAHGRVSREGQRGAHRCSRDAGREGLWRRASEAAATHNFAVSNDISCIEPPAERFVGKNDWWAYALAVGGIGVCFVLLVLVGAPSCLLPARRRSPRSLRSPVCPELVDLYGDRFVIAFGFRNLVVRIADVADAEEVRRRMGAPTANANACVRIALRDSAAFQTNLPNVAPPTGELFVALYDNARFIEELAERQERLKHFC